MHSNQREEINEILAGDIALRSVEKDVDHLEPVQPDGHHHALRNYLPRSGDPRVRSSPRNQPYQESWASRRPSGPGRPVVPRQYRTKSRADHHLRMGSCNHLEIMRRRMKREFVGMPTSASPQVAYRERSARRCMTSRASRGASPGGKGQYGHFVLKLAPQEHRKVEFVDRPRAASCEGNFILPRCARRSRPSLPAACCWLSGWST